MLALDGVMTVPEDVVTPLLEVVCVGIPSVCTGVVTSREDDVSSDDVDVGPPVVAVWVVGIPVGMEPDVV